MPDRESLAAHWRATLGTLLLSAALVAGTGACRSADSTAVSGARLNVRLADFSITAGKLSVPAGRVVLHVTNAGPSAHGLQIDRTEFGSGALPLRKDNLSADERAKGMHRVGLIDEIELDHTRDLPLRLRPGHYVLWCNREGHYLGGMRTTLTVR
jgi:uncharacterized cupredoxin-like copper-binding protein